MRLPAFVTAASLEDILAWVNSIRRMISQSANVKGIQNWASSPADDCYYTYVVRLLEEPLGGLQLDRLVIDADPDKQRTLTKAISRIVAQKMGLSKSPAGDARVIRRLLNAGFTETAGWLAFNVLSRFSNNQLAEGHVEAVVEIIEENDELRSLLGDYWLDWQSNGQSDTQACRSPSHDTVYTSKVSLEAIWRELVAKIAIRLDKAQPFDNQLIHDVKDDVEALKAIYDRWVESNAQAGEAARRIEQILELMRAKLVGMSSELAWPASIISAIEAGAWRQATPEVVSADAAWLEAAGASVIDVETRFAQSRDAYALDDNDDTFEALRGARVARTEERARCQLAADALLNRLQLEFGFEARVEAERTYGNANGKCVGTVNSVSITILPGLLDHSTNQKLSSAALLAEAPLTISMPEGASHSAVANGYSVESQMLVAPVDDGESVLRDDVGVDFAPVPVVDPALDMADAVVAQALEDGRYGLAAYVAEAAEALGGRVVAGAGSAVLRAVCVGEALDDQRLTAVEAAYSKLLPNMLEEIERTPTSSKSLCLLVLAGALRPALFSFHAGASEVLRRLEVGHLGRGPHLLVDFILTELPRRGGMLDLAMMGPVIDQPALKAALASARQRLLDMAEAAPKRKALYARASFIWRELFKHGPVQVALDALRHSPMDALCAVEIAAGWLSKDIPALATELDRKARSRREAALEGAALDWLQISLRDLRSGLQAWLNAHHGAAASRTTRQIETRDALLDLVRSAAVELGALASDRSLTPALGVCQREFEDVIAMLEGRAQTERSTLRELDTLLHADLLLFDPYPAAVRQGSWSPVIATAFILQAQAVVERAPDWAAAFERLLRQARFAEAEQAAACLSRDGRPDDKALIRIQDERVAYLHASERRVGGLRIQADDLLGADIDGKIDPAVAVRLDALAGALQRIGPTDDAVSERLDTVALEQELAELERDLQCGADMLLAPLEHEINVLQTAGHNVSTLRDLAAKRDLTSLRDSLAGSHSGVGADGSGEDTIRLLQAFGERFACKSFEGRPSSDRSVGRAIDGIRQRVQGPVFDASRLSEADCDQAVKLLHAWQGLFGGKAADTALRDLLQELRLTGVKIEKQTPQNRARAFSASLDPTIDRRDCPTPAFGSAATGKLNVLVADLQGLNGTELHGLAVRAFNNGSVVPVLVIVKGVLPAEHRLLFMKEARRHTAQVSSALLDEASILFLAMRPGRTRGDMFAIALPAGGVQPYSNASSKSSPEMFFGRADELAALWDQGGSCLVYGGRQLGKTALLQQVKVRHDRPPHQVVPYMTLQGDRDLWGKTGSLLKEAGIPCDRATKDGVRAAIRAWLEKDIGRRILILIDEADTFLAAEIEENYPTLIAVRDLMQETGRRCKFVFAGLHDVQRVARTPNSPLHHLGMPLGIGPLFGKDLADARSMVVIPMAAAGIVFAEPSLPNRILSAVGFYPSLLQTFGQTLLAMIAKSIDRRLKIDQLLPIRVTLHDVNEALEDTNFKRDIGDKFDMTLDLDERYRLITLAILHRTLDRREQGDLALPLTDVKIQELSRDWWPQGFAEDASLSAFQGLLQEMVGLGVLLQSDNRYAIRSSRIAAMLGGKEQIDQKLLELSGHEAPGKIDTGSLRRLDKVNRDPAPLTYRQNSLLVDWERYSPPVYLVLASKALGIDDLPASLSDLQTDNLAVQTRRYDSKRAFEVVLAEMVQCCVSGRRNLAVLSGPWLGRDVVDLALENACIRKSPRGLRIVLVPHTVDWDAVDAADGSKLWGAEILTLSPLGRTGLRQWLRAKDVKETSDSIDQLRDWTGGFVNIFKQLPANFGRDRLSPRGRPGAGQLGVMVSRGDLGLDDERLFSAAQIIMAYDIETNEDALEVIDGRNPSMVLRHLERLGIVERHHTEASSLDFNPLVRRWLASLD